MYIDKLVEFTDKELVLKNYYFPSAREKKISIVEIEYVLKLIPNLKTGKYRIWGSGSLLAWAPCDVKRNIRQFIYCLKLTDQKVRPFFTVENETLFEAELYLKKLEVRESDSLFD